MRVENQLNEPANKQPNEPVNEPVNEPANEQPQRAPGRDGQRPEHWHISLFLLLPLSAVLLSLLFLLFYRPPEREASTFSQEAGRLRLQLRDGEAGRYFALGEHRLLHVDALSCSILNMAGVELQRYPIPMNDPMVLREGPSTLVFDLNGTTYIVLNEQGRLYQGSTSDRIKGATVAADGRSALILDRAESLGSVLVLDRSGEKILEWIARDRRQSGYPIKLHFNASAPLLDVSLYNTERDRGRSLVQSLRLDADSPGEVADSFTAEQVGALTYLDRRADGSLYMASDRYLLYRDAQAKVVSFPFNQIIQAIPQGDGVVLLGERETGSGWGLYYWTGEEGRITRLGERRYTEDSRLYAVERERFAVRAGQQILCFEGPRTAPSASYAFETPIHRAYREGRSLIVITEDSLERLR